MSEHRGVSSRVVVRGLVLRALAGVLGTLVCWAALMVEVGHVDRVPVFMLDQQSSGVVR